MTDLSTTITPRSDQINSDDMLTGPMTIRITKVSGNPGSREQPISIYFEGDDGKPYKPCLSMRRVLVQVWGKDGSAYVGRSMTLFRDPSVMFGGVAVGGIRISHMSDIDKPVTMALTASKTSRKQYTVEPLRDAPRKSAPKAEQPDKTIDERAAALIASFDDANTEAGLASRKKHPRAVELLATLEREQMTATIDKIEAAYDARLGAIRG